MLHVSFIGSKKMNHDNEALKDHFCSKVNPHQLVDAAAFVHNFPEIPVILNHMGCLHLGIKAHNGLATSATVSHSICL